MELSGSTDTALVVAAQAGDQRALDDLVAAHLPLVYTIVRRAVLAPVDTDDVVQETMLRALRELRELREPESFRAWLAAIATRQISTYLRRRQLSVERTAALDEVAGSRDVETDVESLTLLELELSGQRRQVVLASQWLDPDDRALLSLWWLEVAGQLTRTELATAIGVSVAHAGVRVQRMRQQLDAARSLVAAVEMPRCAELGGLLSDWDGQPTSLWRKRIARHVRSCEVCEPGSTGLVATERLLVGFALLPVPLALVSALRGKGVASLAAFSVATGGGAAKVGVLAKVVQTIAAHPVVASVVAGVVVLGAGAAAVNPAQSTRFAVTAPTSAPPPRPTPTTPRPTVATTAPSIPATPSTAASAASHGPKPALAAGPVSLESVNEAGFFMSAVDTYGVLAKTGPGSDSQTRQQATFEVVIGLADPNCFSFRLADGEFLRHSSWRLRVNPNDGSALFRGDATFCVRVGSAAGSISLESANYPGWFLHHRANELWVDQTDGTPGFLADSSFRSHPALSS